MITNLEITKLHPHPDNPRKDLGDLTELAESIKIHGVLQNLTVVPWFSEIVRAPADDGKMDGHYRVVIGHRRLAAAKLAGFTELPCIILDMDLRTQVATMLLENIQRNDLTVYEQAQGFQMMIDLGETVYDISDKTGFSESTVRRRVKLLELDQEKFQKSVTRGATLQDFIKLEEISDPELKNEVLDSVGTSNFAYEVKKAVDQEKKDQQKAALIAEVETFATEIEMSEIGSYKYVRSYSLGGNSEVERPDDADEHNYFFTTSSYSITIYTEKSEEDIVANKEEAERNRAREERQKGLKEINDRARQLRFDFINSLTGLKKKFPIIAEFAVQTILLEGWQYSFESDTFCELVGMEPGGFDMEDIAPTIAKSPERTLLAAAYAKSGDDFRQTYHNWSGEYTANDPLDTLYSYLEHLGYDMSDEERAYREGTHELFVGSKAANDDPEDPCEMCKSAHPSCDGCCKECDDKCNSGQRCRKQDDDTEGTENEE